MHEKPGPRTTLTLVYPNDADPEQACVSVLSPLGRALIGALTCPREADGHCDL